MDCWNKLGWNGETKLATVRPNPGHVAEGSLDVRLIDVITIVMRKLN